MMTDRTSLYGSRKGVALGGFMGVGKSTVARMIAVQTGLALVDTDDELVRIHGAIAEQFSAHGESAFRAREREVVLKLCDGKPRVLATGGGVFASERLRRALADHYVLITLRASVHTLRTRLGADETRPLWTAHAARLLRSRELDYADVFAIIDVDGKTVNEVVEEVLACIG